MMLSPFLPFILTTTGVPCEGVTLKSANPASTITRAREICSLVLEGRRGGDDPEKADRASANVLDEARRFTVR
jgi:hypothetical protein